jgi:hypothetical protein
VHLDAMMMLDAYPKDEPAARWGCALLCELTSSKALVMAFDGYVDTVLEPVEPSASLALLVAGFQG